MRLRYRRSAIDDLGEIRDYIARDNPTAAKRFLARLRARCRLLSEQPHIGRERPESDRACVACRLRTTSSSIDWSMTVEIVSVVHDSRDVDTLFDEEP
jgi:plasmid stabilization system protein ParE